jgi:hypothetical protein
MVVPIAVFDDVRADLFDAQLAAVHALVVHAMTRRNARYKSARFLHLIDPSRDYDPAMLIHAKAPLQTPASL